MLVRVLQPPFCSTVLVSILQRYYSALLTGANSRGMSNEQITPVRRQFDASIQGYTGHSCATSKPLLHMTGIREPVDLGYHPREKKMGRLLYGFQTAGPCEPQVAHCLFGLCRERVSVTADWPVAKAGEQFSSCQVLNLAATKVASLPEACLSSRPTRSRKR